MAMNDPVTDFGLPRYIRELAIQWPFNRPYAYALELSLDGENWISACGGAELTAVSQCSRHFIHAKARYIRVAVKGDKERMTGSPDVSIVTGDAPAFIKGADVSQLQQIEDHGGKYFDREGIEKDCLEILKEHGVNFIRLRIWNKPGLPKSDPAGYNDKAHVLEMAQRVFARGFGLLLDFHYSDWWTDPGKQAMPVEWEGMDFEALNAALYGYTHDVVSSLKAQGTMPSLVQVGNEITGGMLWNAARVSDEFDTKEQWDALCALLESGLRAVKTVDPSIKTIIHIDRGGDNAGSTRFFDRIAERGVDFDVIGLSYYPIWHGPVSDFQANARDLARRYGKEILLVETAFPYTRENGDDTPNATASPYTRTLPEYPLSVQGQADILQAIFSAMKTLPGEKGIGVFYWAPEFIPVKGAGWKYGEGSEWDDQTLFDFKGRALWSLDVLRMH